MDGAERVKNEGGQQENAQNTVFLPENLKGPIDISDYSIHFFCSPVFGSILILRKLECRGRFISSNRHLPQASELKAADSFIMTRYPAVMFHHFLKIPVIYWFGLALIGFDWV
jgi:hypothetical protein